MDIRFQMGDKNTIRTSEEGKDKIIQKVMLTPVTVYRKKIWRLLVPSLDIIFPLKECFESSKR